MNLTKISIVLAATFITLLMLAGLRAGFQGNALAASQPHATTQSNAA